MKTRPLATLIAIQILAACNGGGSPAPDDPITWTPRGGIRERPPADDRGQLPEGGSGIVPTSLDSDFFEFTGPPVPGSASLVDAVVWDPFTSEAPPFGAGGLGAIDATVEGSRYGVTDGDAFVALFTDDTGVTYLVLSIFSETDVPGVGWFQTNVAVFVPASDFAPGATVELDGIDRVAIFAAGPDGPEPTIFAAAITGRVTFGATGSIAIGDHLSATVAADFAPAVSIPPPAPDGVPLVAGGYDLVVDPVPEVICGGTLEGHEAAFAAVTLDPIGVTSGPVTLAFPAEAQLTIEGAAIGGAFGAPALLDAVAEPPDTYVAITDLTGAGPDASELAGAYLLVEGRPLDATSAAAAVGLAYVDPAGEGGCDALFQATLTPR